MSRFALTLLALLYAAIPAGACKYVRGPFLLALESAAAPCNHPLCGQIVPTARVRMPRDETSCGADTWMALSGDLTQALSSGGVVLLGEMHDNAAQHSLRAKLIAELTDKSGDPPALVFEQLTSAQQSGLDRFAELQTTDAAVATLSEFKRAVEWDKGGWAKYDYDALLQAALDGKHAIYAGDVPRDAMMKAAKEGANALAAETRTRLGIDTPLDPKLDDASLAEIEAAHCGAMPKSAFGGMAFAQRYRDAHLADVALNAAEKHGSAVLIAGNGHVRTDRGVPWYIHQRAPDKKVVSVLLIEVEDGQNDPETYAPRDPDGNPAADYIIFTPRADRGDPCEGIKAKKAG
ncbi:MAG: ChaN family lipoprotein [Hyphomicrobium sp.]